MAGFRLDLGERLDGMLEDFCESFFGADKTKVIRAALDEFIPAKVDENPERGELYHRLRQRRQS